MFYNLTPFFLSHRSLCAAPAVTFIGRSPPQQAKPYLLLASPNSVITSSVKYFLIS